MNTSMKKAVAVSSILLFLLGSTQVFAATGDNKPDQMNTQSSEEVLNSSEKEETSAKSESPNRLDRQQIKDAWIQGKIEAALTLNRHLNPFVIDTNVEDGVVSLSGTVETEIDKELAGEIAKSIEEVKSVNNNLEVKADLARETDSAEGKNDWKQRISDITTSAIVKTKLLANSGTEGLSIGVSTKQNVVVLEGEVNSAQARDLAELIAENTDGVKDVDNRLRVKGS